MCSDKAYYSPPPSPSVLSVRREEADEEVKGKRGCREKCNRASSKVRAVYEGDVNQIQRMQVQQRASSSGPSSRLSSSACFLTARSDASLHWNEGAPPPSASSTGLPDKGAKHTTVLLLTDMSRRESLSLLTTLLHLSAPSLPTPPSSSPPSFSISSQPLRCLPSRSPHYSPSRIHSVSTRSCCLSLFPTHISVGALLCAGGGAATGSYLGR